MSLLDYRLFTELNNHAWHQNTFTRYYQLPSAGAYVINGMECRGATNWQHSSAAFSSQHSSKDSNYTQ